MDARFDGRPSDAAPRAGPGIKSSADSLTAHARTRAAGTDDIGKRAATDHRDTHEHLEPQVGSYAKQFKNAGTEDIVAMALDSIVRGDAPRAHMRKRGVAVVRASRDAPDRARRA